MEIQTIGIIGLGLMGRGLIHSFASHGFNVMAIKRRDNDTRLLDYLQYEINKERLTVEEYEYIISNIRETTDINDASKCHLIIENIHENADEKMKLFNQLDQVCPSNTVFSSNTSTIPIGKLANTTKRSDKFVGLHYFSPVPVMPLVEIVKGINTSEETIDACRKVNEAIGKTPVVVNDMPGFVSSRVLSIMVNEAAHAYMQGVADAEAIDTIVTKGFNFPVGPLRLADLVGLDVALDSLDSLFDNFKDPKYRACPLLRVMVQSGNLGRKSGQGFYSYN